MSELVGTPEDRFSRVVAHLIPKSDAEGHLKTGLRYKMPPRYTCVIISPTVFFFVF